MIYVYQHHTQILLFILAFLQLTAKPCVKLLKQAGSQALMIPPAHTEATMKINGPSKHTPFGQEFVFSLQLLGTIIN